MPKVEIESFWDRLGVELWPNYCFETQNLDFCGGDWIRFCGPPLFPNHQIHKIDQIEGFKPLGPISRQRACKNMPKVDIESFWDRLGVELWPKYCF